MTPEWQFIFLFIAFVAFVIAAAWAWPTFRSSTGLIVVGLASWVLISLWSAMKAI